MEGPDGCPFRLYKRHFHQTLHVTRSHVQDESLVTFINAKGRRSPLKHHNVGGHLLTHLDPQQCLPIVIQCNGKGLLASLGRPALGQQLISIDAATQLTMASSSQVSG